MSEIEIELISENCKYCPCLELETIQTLKTHHRCKNLQMCRAVLAYWKNGDFFKDLEVKVNESPNNGTVKFERVRYIPDEDRQGCHPVIVKEGEAE